MTEQMLEIQGSLIFDSWTESGPELRADNPEDRHLIYEGGGIILDLLLKRAEKGSCLHIGGQVLPAEPSLDAVSDLKVSMQHGTTRESTHTNALGEFTFHAVPNGTFDVAITLKNRRFSVRGLSHSEPRAWQVIPSFAVGGD